MKDLSKLGRDLKKTIIVDNIAENFCLQKDNGIFIKTWYDDQDDTELEKIGSLLKELVINQVSDVGKTLRHYRDQMILKMIHDS